MNLFTSLVIAFVIACLGCSKQPPPKPPPQYYTLEKFDKIQNGMTMEQMEAHHRPLDRGSARAAAPPKNKSGTAGDDEIDIDFVGGKVTAKSNHGLQ